MEGMAELASAKSLPLVAALGELPPAVLGDPVRIAQILYNLLSNAIKFTAEGSVQLRVEASAGELQFHVVDTGPGIAAEHIPRLTERFYRVDRGRSRETGGTGLGLAIVKHVAQRHGAQLLIDSMLGRGSRFAIRFPATRVREKVSAVRLSREATTPSLRREPPSLTV